VFADGDVAGMRAIASSRGVAVVAGPGRGKGAAIRQAIDSTESEIIVFVDADGSHNVGDIPRLLEPLLSGEAEMVIGSRITGGSAEFSGSPVNVLHYLGNCLSSGLINAFWRGAVSDCQNGFRAARTGVLRGLRLRENGFCIEQEMVIKCLRHRLRIKEIPSFESERKAGKSHLKRFGLVADYIRCIVRNIL
jgi:dolichol-phosphate mannosyltransferase